MRSLYVIVILAFAASAVLAQHPAQVTLPSKHKHRHIKPELIPPAEVVVPEAPRTIPEPPAAPASPATPAVAPPAAGASTPTNLPPAGYYTGQWLMYPNGSMVWSPYGQYVQPAPQPPVYYGYTYGSQLPCGPGGCRPGLFGRLFRR